MDSAQLKQSARAMIRHLRDSNFSVWYSDLGPYQALKLQEQHAKEIAPLVSEAEAAPAEGEGEAKEAPPLGSEVGYIKNDDGSVQRLKIPEKDVRMKAIVYLARLQRYLEDLPARQVTPPKSAATGMPRNTTVGDAIGEVSLRWSPCCVSVGRIGSSTSPPSSSPSPPLATHHA